MDVDDDAIMTDHSERTIALYLSTVFHYVFKIAPRGDRRIYLVVISYYTALPCGIHSMYTHLFPEARAQRLLVCGRALLVEVRTHPNTIEIYIFNKHKHINIPSFYIIYYIISHYGAVAVKNMPPKQEEVLHFTDFTENP